MTTTAEVKQDQAAREALRVDALVRALERLRSYTRHLRDCAKNRGDPTCSCGLGDTRLDAEAAIRGGWLQGPHKSVDARRWEQLDATARDIPIRAMGGAEPPTVVRRWIYDHPYPAGSPAPTLREALDVARCVAADGAEHPR